MTLRIRGRARRIEGAAPSTDPLFARGALEDDEGQALTSVAIGAAFEVDTVDDGGRIRIEVDADTTGGPRGTTRGTWSEIEAAHPALFRDGLEGKPGPHVTVTLRAIEVRDGDPVAIEGEALEQGFDEHVQGLREASVPAMRAMRATSITRTDLAEEAPTKPRKKQEAPRPGVPTKRTPAFWRGVFLACAAVSLVATARVPFGPLTLDALSWALTFIGLAAWVAWTGVAPHFVRVETLASVENRGIALFVALFPLSVSFCHTFGDVAGVANLGKGEPPNASIAVAGCNAAALVLLCAGLLWTTRRTRPLLQSLLEAEPFAKGGGWGSVTGVVRDPTPIAVAHEPGALAVAQVTAIASHGSDPDIVTQSERTDGTFFVDAGDITYEIDPEKAIWATTIPASRKQTSQTDQQITLRVPVGAHVLVAGRAAFSPDRATARLSASGPESLLFFATSEGDDARGRCTAIRRRLEITIAVLVVTAAALVVAAGGLAPRLPPTVFPAGSD